MKIAMLIKNFVTTGGAERYAVELATRLARRGHEIHLYSQRWDAALLPGLTLHAVPRIHRPAYLNSLFYAIETHRRVKQESFDVIHSHQRTIHHHVLTMHHPCYRVGKNASSPFSRMINAIRGVANPRHRVYQWLESRQFGCRSLTHVVAVSDGTKQDILAHYPLDPSKVHVVYPGVDSARMSYDAVKSFRIDIRKQHGLTDNDLAMVFVGSEFKRKGLQCVLEALGLLQRDDRLPIKPHLFVLGSGDPTAYRGLAERLRVGHLVHFVGLYPNVEHYYAAADLFVLPTLSDPFPLVVLEAMAFGLPVIVSKLQGVAELLKDGDNAVLLDDPRDAHRISAAVTRLSNKQVRLELGRRARETALALTWDRMTDEILPLYDDVILKKMGRSR